MRKKTEKIKVIIAFVFAILFASANLFSVLAKPPVDDFQISEEEEEEGEEGEEEESEEQRKAREAEERAREEALVKRTNQLIEEVKKLANDDDAVIQLLTKEENKEARTRDAFLVERLLDALLRGKKPNYELISTVGKELCNLQKDSSKGYYAQALNFMYKKKPNYKEALKQLDKAKKAKNPYKDVGSAYTTCLLKCYGLYAIIGIVVLLVLLIAIIVNIIKKKKAKKLEASSDAQEDDNIDLQKLLDETEPGSESQEKTVEEKNITDSDKVSNSTENTNSENIQNIDNVSKNAINLATDSSSVDKVINEIFDNSNSEASKKDKTKNIVQNPQSDNKPVSTKEVKEKTDEVVTNTSSSPVKKVVRVVKKVRVRKDANGNSYVVSEDTSTQNENSKNEDTNYLPETNTNLGKVMNFSRTVDKPLPPVDTQLDILWGNLSRKAMQGHIAQFARKSDSLSSSLGSSFSGGNTESYSGYSHDNRISDIRLGDVSIDLSEEALKDDLVGKLKMLAITDAELRELFAMKNPAHIPHLIEYIMTKPEPMRLAFIAKELGNYSDPAVVDALSSLLYHEDERVVLAAIQGLEATKLPAAVIPLCPFLKAEIPLYAQAARTALSKFGAAKIMQALKDLPSFTDLKLKEAGIFVLSRMKGEPVEKILKSLLNDESSSVRIQTILAMSYQKNPVYIDALREFYRIANESEKSMTRKAIVYLNGFNK